MIHTCCCCCGFSFLKFLYFILFLFVLVTSNSWTCPLDFCVDACGVVCRNDRQIQGVFVEIQTKWVVARSNLQTKWSIYVCFSHWLIDLRVRCNDTEWQTYIGHVNTHWHHHRNGLMAVTMNGIVDEIVRSIKRLEWKCSVSLEVMKSRIEIAIEMTEQLYNFECIKWSRPSTFGTYNPVYALVALGVLWMCEKKKTKWKIKLRRSRLFFWFSFHFLFCFVSLFGVFCWLLNDGARESIQKERRHIVNSISIAKLTLQTRVTHYEIWFFLLLCYSLKWRCTFIYKF